MPVPPFGFQRIVNFSLTTIGLDQRDIVRGLKNGDKSALDALYDKYGSALFGVVVRILNDREVAEEVLQDTFLRIWNKCHYYDPVKGSLFTWMMQIARNLAINRSRKVDFSKKTKTETIEKAVSVEESQLNVETLDIKRNLSKLNENYRSAELLEIPLGTLKTRLQLGLRDLRKIYR